MIYKKNERKAEEDNEPFKSDHYVNVTRETTVSEVGPDDLL